jgi:hypothetical protein
VLYLNRHETWGRVIFALSSDKGFEEVSHYVKKYSCFADTAENSLTDSLYNMVMRGDLHDKAVGLGRLLAFIKPSGTRALNRSCWIDSTVNICD